MSDWLLVAAIALLPAAGAMAGSALAETVRTPRWLIGAALHAAAGVAIAVVSAELPRIIRNTPGWLMACSFLVGAGFPVLLARCVAWLQRKPSGRPAAAWMVYAAIAADLFSDGLMAGAGSAVSGSLGMLLGVSQLVANVPGGFATASNLRKRGVPQRTRLLVGASFIVPALGAAAVSFLLLRGTTAAAHNAALAFVVGVLLLATVEDIVPQADEPSPKRWISTASFAAGFCLLALASAYLG